MQDVRERIDGADLLTPLEAFDGLRCQRGRKLEVDLVRCWCA